MMMALIGHKGKLGRVSPDNLCPLPPPLQRSSLGCQRLKLVVDDHCPEMDVRQQTNFDSTTQKSTKPVEMRPVHIPHPYLPSKQGKCDSRFVHTFLSTHLVQFTMQFFA